MADSLNKKIDNMKPWQTVLLFQASNGGLEKFQCCVMPGETLPFTLTYYENNSKKKEWKLTHNQLIELRGSAIGDAELSFDAMLAMVADCEAILKVHGNTPEYRNSKHFIRLFYYPRTNTCYKDSTNAVSITFGNIKELLAKFFMTLHYQKQMKNWREWCIGIPSRIGNADMHMPVLDYDGKNIKRHVNRDVAKLQAKFGLGSATLYTTRGGIHVYFPTDQVTWATFREILVNSACCEGFRKASLQKKNAILRVSAKYTKFDIQKLKSIHSNANKGRRPHLQAVIADSLIDLGASCCTHLAAMYPQWCNFEEDPKEWKPPKKTAKKVKLTAPPNENHTSLEIKDLEKQGVLNKIYYGMKPDGTKQYMYTMYNKQYSTTTSTDLID